MTIQSEHATITLKSLIDISLAGLKLLALFNGGAAVALLAYMGNVAGKGMSLPDMRWPMKLYLAGLLCCGLTFFASYLTQLFLYNESIGEIRSGWHVYFQRAGIAFALLSLLFFIAGSYVAAESFPTSPVAPVSSPSAGQPPK